MNLNELKQRVKQIALDSGAVIVGFGNLDRLKSAPPSGDMGYCLPGAQSCIMWAYAAPLETLEKYFSKVDRMGFKKFQHFAYSTAWRTAEEIAIFIEENSEFKAFSLIPNGKYRAKGSYTNALADKGAFPDFSLRYGAVAAGLGHLGWSGNLVTKDYGASLFLGGVLTTAPLEPDPMASENHCNKCKICVKSCSTGFFSERETEEPVTIGGQQEIYAKRNSYFRCSVGCAGWVGLSPDKTWSSWAPGQVCLKLVSEDQITTPAFKSNLMKSLLSDRNTPKVNRKFNQIIVTSFAKVADSENVGLRPLEDTNPRCGFCSAICVADPNQRKKLYDLLLKSGKIYLDEEGNELVRKQGENGELVEHRPPLNV